MPKTKNDYIHIRATPQLKQAYQEALEVLDMSATEHITQEIEKLIAKAKRKKSP